METLGSLVDKLTIANVRLWHLEEQRRDKTLPDSARLKAADMVAIVNAQRNALVDEIDAFLELAIAGKVKLTDPKCKTYYDAKISEKR